MMTLSIYLVQKIWSRDTLVILSILYPWADLRNNFHIDHIFPKSTFTVNKLLKKGVPDDKIDEFIEKKLSWKSSVA